jgi:hypothetical protein
VLWTRNAAVEGGSARAFDGGEEGLRGERDQDQDQDQSNPCSALRWQSMQLRVCGMALRRSLPIMHSQPSQMP